MKQHFYNMLVLICRAVLAIVMFFFSSFIHQYTPFSLPAHCFASENDIHVEETFASEENDPYESRTFTIEGFIELENFLNTYEDQDFEDANVKNEIRTRLEITYGTDTLFLYAVPNIYLASGLLGDDFSKTYDYSDETKTYRNLRFSASSHEVLLSELYLNYTHDKFRMRVGNQIYGWGTADFFNPTSYFNPYDMREILYKDEDEYKAGVPSVSGMIFLNNFTLELVYVPIHIPEVLTPKNNFWSFNIDNYQLPIVFGETDELDREASNDGFGARLSTSIKSADVSFSCYHGPDKDTLFLPFQTHLVQNNPVAVLVTPQYYVIDAAGIDFSMSMDAFVLQFETAYFSNKRGVEEQTFNELGDISFPYKVRKSDYISYTIGFTYFIPLYNFIEGHEGETILALEWFQAHYFEDNLSKPILTDLIFFRFQDSFFSNHLYLTFTGIFDTEKQGYSIWPKIGYDFQNGFSVELSYAEIAGESDEENTTESIFYYFRNNDVLMLRLKYAF